jgi:hypothetical protein
MLDVVQVLAICNCERLRHTVSTGRVRFIYNAYWCMTVMIDVLLALFGAGFHGQGIWFHLVEQSVFPSIKIGIYNSAPYQVNNYSEFH